MPFNRIFLCIAALLFLGVGLVSAEPEAAGGARKPVTPFYLIESEKLPLTFKSSEAVENPARLDFCEKTLIQMMFHLGLDGGKKTRFAVSWDDQASNSVWVDTFPRGIRHDGKDWVFTIKGQGKWKTGREQLYRTLAICLLQSRMLPENGGILPSSLPEPPLWLSEGITQILMRSRHQDFASAVWRFSLAKKVPSLDAIQTWTELSEDGIRRSWQQTFSFWLAVQATRTKADKTTLLGYMESYLKEPGKRYWSGEMAHEEWWQRSTYLSMKPQIPGYDWQQSVAHLQEAIVIAVKYKNDDVERLISITELPKNVQSLQSPKPIEETKQKLGELEARSHPLIRPVAAYYKNALLAWNGGNIDGYAANLRAAREKQKEVTLMREKANDLLDWFTVNYELDIEEDDYRDYALRVEELENARKTFRDQVTEQTTAN